MSRVFVWDLETLNIFTATFVDLHSDDKYSFVISDTKDNRKELFKFLENVDVLIGYNSVFFDAQIIEYMYRYPNCTAKDIQRYAMLITADMNRKPDVPEWKLRHTHIDLFKTLSLSVKAKRTGLKWCEFMIDFENIEDIPSQGDGMNWEEQVLSYNLNDVLATKALFLKFKHEFDLRNTMSSKENINLINSTEPDMAKKLFAKYLSKAMDVSKFDLLSMGTEREMVHIKDTIFPYVEFKTIEFNSILNKFKNLSLGKQDKANFTLMWNNIPIDFGLGGIHAAPNNRIVRSDDRLVIKSFDATSYYPHLMFQNDLCPAHLPKDIFLPLYRGFYEQRQNIPKSDPSNYILKILLNSTYGLTNDEYSFLRDRFVTLSICINGQLLLAMLVERLTTEIPECQMVMMNTDGAEVIMPREYEDKYQEICKWWEELTRIPLEHVEYEKMIIRDVNNYISIFTNGKTKCKGAFEFENIPLHKNKSHAIIPKAVYEYFVHNVPVEETILNHQNIFDFCAGVKSRKTDIKGASWYELISFKDGQLKSQKLSKTVRYFVSNKGAYLYKCYEDGDRSHQEAPLKIGSFMKDWKVTYFNKYWKATMEEYDIDYRYYIHKANEIVANLEPPRQLSLF